MVDVKSVHAQLKRIKFNGNAWGKAEIRELPNILTPDEKVYECVNGIYDGGFALLVSTDMRVLLIDKKPLNYLRVEDLRFDMINEIDYSHRLMGAQITISAGSKTLKFTSYNQQRLRKLISHVQDRMSEMKKEQSDHQEEQKRNLMQINQQLQAYLLAQHQQLMQIQQGKTSAQPAEAIKPSPELSDYLFAQSLLTQFNGGAVPQSTVEQPVADTATADVPLQTAQPVPVPEAIKPAEEKTTPPPTDDLYAEGYQEIFGKTNASPVQAPQPVTAAAQIVNPLGGYLSSASSHMVDLGQQAAKSLEVNALKIAYAKLPMMLRNRKFGRPSFHDHSQAPSVPAQTQPAIR